MFSLGMLKITDYRLHYSQNNKTWNFKVPFIYVDMRGGRGEGTRSCIVFQRATKGSVTNYGSLYHGGCLKLQWCFMIFVR